MWKTKVRYLEQLGKIQRIEHLCDGSLIVYTVYGMFYAKDTGRVYEIYATERTFRNLKQEGGKLA